MNSVVFSTASQAYQVANIVYAGPVQEIPANYRKGECTHSFKLITMLGAAFCYYRDIEAAKKARGALSAIMESVKPNIFKSGYEELDPRSVITFGRAFKLKNPQGEHTHAFVVTVATADENSAEVWLTYKNEDHVEKARRALYASINNLKGTTEEQTAVAQQESKGGKAGDGFPF